MTAAELQLLEEYPCSDGQPMAEGTVQCDWIFKIKTNFDWVFRDDPDVFVACDLLWYPVEGQSKTNAAPDSMVVFGRPKGDRLSYIQFMEENVAPQVVIEVRSPSNTPAELARKFAFYQKYGVEEYYLYDPAKNRLEGWLRSGDKLVEIPKIEAGWRSPRLDIHMEVLDELVLTDPEGEEFADANAIREQRRIAIERAEEDARRAKLAMQRADRMAKRAEADAQRAEAESQRADMAEQQAAVERLQTQLAKERADQEKQRADQMALEIERLKAMLQGKAGG